MADHNLTSEQEDECRDKIRADLADIAQQEVDLARGKAQFPPDFDLAVWTEAFNGDEDRWKTGAVNWPVSTIVNDINGILMSGAVLDGLMPWSLLKKSTPSHYEALAKHQIISSPTKIDLERANRIRNTMTHHYANATGEDVYELVRLLEKLLPRLREELTSWLTKLGAVEP